MLPTTWPRWNEIEERERSHFLAVPLPTDSIPSSIHGWAIAQQPQHYTAKQKMSVLTLWGEGWELYYQWRMTPSAQDGQVSGVLADWLEDNERELTRGRPEWVLDGLRRTIKYFRARLGNPRNSAWGTY